VISRDDKNSYNEKPRARAISFYFQILSHNTHSGIEHLYAFYIIYYVMLYYMIYALNVENLLVDSGRSGGGLYK